MRRVVLLAALVGATLVPAPSVGADGPPAAVAPFGVCDAGAHVEEVPCLRGLPRFGAAPIPTRSALRPSGDLDCALDGWDDRCERWTSLYDNPNGSAGGGPDQVTATAAGHRRVYVTGGSWDDTTQHYDMLTVAYDQETGQPVWSSRYDGALGLFDVGYGIAVDPGEQRVFVAGTRDGPDTFGGDAAIVALDAGTGAVLWTASFDGSAGDHDVAYSVTLDGGTVYAAGKAHGASTGEDAFVLAVDAATGERRWVATELDDRYDAAYAVRAVAGRVVAVGAAESPAGDLDQLVVAFETEGARAGETAWTGRFGAGGYDDGFGLDVDPSGTTAVVTGTGQRGPGASPRDYLTVAYDLQTGDRRWVARFAAPDAAAASGQGVATAAAVSPDGRRVYVTGTTTGSEPSVGSGFTTVAYDLASGQQVWASPFHPAATSYGVGTSIAVAPNGRRVYSTGNSFAGYFVMKGGYATVAHDAETGAQLWAGWYIRQMDEPADLLPYASYAAAARDGKRVFVSGTFVNALTGDGTQTFSDYWTLAYDA